MKVSIVIPNWNGQEKLRKNLPSVLKVKGVDEVIVSDDASTDDSLQVLASEFPEVKVIKRDRNGGFSSNVNTGVKAATGELIFLINSDASPSPDSLAVVLKHFADPKVFSVGCNTGGTWSWAKFERGYLWHYESKEQSPNAHQTLWSSGGSGIFRKKIWNELGGLDELFDPFYEEDMDLGYRATKRGYLNIFEPKSRVEHYKEKGVIELNFSKDRVSKVAQRNQLFVIWKNITDPTFLRDHQIALIKRLLTHPKYFLIFFSAAVHLPELLKKKSIEQQKAKLSDKEILESSS